MADIIQYEASDGIATITLNRPDSLNALNTEISHALIDVLGTVAQDATVRCVILTGAGRAFCSGADLAEAQERIDAGQRLDVSEILRDRYHRIIMGIVEMEKPVIAAVNGVAAGAGASLALACDLRVGSDKAKFLQAFIKIGLIPDSGANHLLPHLVGYAKAMELALTGDMIDADEALRLGLINRVVPAEDLLKEARAWAEPFASGPTRAYGLTKKAMRFGATNDLAATLDYEADLQDQAAMTHDSLEGIKSFIEKRPPTFEGR